MPRHRSLLLSLAACGLVLMSGALHSQELSPAEKTLSAELQRCPAQKAEQCRGAALKQFDTGLRREFPTPNAAYWAKVLTVLKRHASQLDAEIRAAEKSAAPGGASGNAASGGSRLQACMNAGGTFAECYYWIVVLGGGR